MEKGHYGEYSGNSRHSRVTSHNMAATKRDDKAHMEYLKEDVKYDNKHGHSNIDMTADEKHISKLAGDLKYDEKHHGVAQHHDKNGPNYGDIKEAPSKITQFFRGVKYDTSGAKNFLKNIATVAGIVAPIPSLGKIKAVSNLTKAFSNAPKQYSTLAKGKQTQSIGGFREFANRDLRDHFNKVSKSKPVDFKGPNPAHKIGAGGNSYPK